jgi:hypothetical protein
MLNVPFWHKADIVIALGEVRFRGVKRKEFASERQHGFDLSQFRQNVLPITSC